MNPYLIIAIGLAIMGAGAGGFKLGRDNVIAGQMRENEQIDKAVAAGVTAAAEAISKIKVVNKTIQNEVQREVQNNVVYRDCKHSPDGLRLLNQSLTGDKPASDSKLPEVVAPSR
jgi:hypothetical protein